MDVLKKREDVDAYDVADDAHGALEKLEDHSDDAVLLDITCPRSRASSSWPSCGRGGGGASRRSSS